MINSIQFCVRVGVALLLGSVIGLERQLRRHPAGLKTNALVSTGSALFILFGVGTAGDAELRIAAQVVSGIGFLGAGLILRDGLHVRGLNTAATV
jgi:putative Mg2+ transporter-C (MgtC) family protein